MQMPNEGKNEALRYAALAWKRKWLIVVPAIVCCVATALYAMRLPNRFRSSTVILVTPQKVPENFVPSTVTTDIHDRLNTIQQQILSRTRLEQIIQEFQLFPNAQANQVPSEVLVETMRKRIAIDVSRGRGTQAFEVSYTDPNPRVAMQVTSKLASLFIDENLKVREQQAIGTSQFLADEIEVYRGKIAEREKAISEFRRKHMDELPERMASNQARLAQLQNQLQMNTQNINSGEDRKVLLQQQIADIERRVQEELERRREAARATAAAAAAAAESLDGTVAVPEGRAPSPAEQELAHAKEELAKLRLSYTDRHPEVVRLAARIDQLEARVAQERAALADAEVAGSGPPGDRTAGGLDSTGGRNERAKGTAAPAGAVDYPPSYYQMKSDVQALELQATRLAVENQRIKEGVEIYQSRIAATPLREMELRQLSEDYESLKAQLERLIENKLRADLSENLERKQKGEQFKILDPANLPEKPVSPNRLRFVAAGFAGGGGLGFGLILALDFLIAGVRNRDELGSLLELPVLGVVPEIETRGDLRRRRMRRFAVSIGSVVCLVAAAGVVHWKVTPLPQAFAQVVQQAKDTYWTTMK